MEMTLLRLSKDRSQFAKLVPHAPAEGLEKTTITLLSALKSFYHEFPDVTRVDIGAFKQWFMTYKATSIATDEKELLGALIDQMRTDVAAGMESGMMERLLTAELASKAVTIIMKWNEGSEVDLHAELAVLAEGFTERLDRKSKIPLVTESPEDLLHMDEIGGGITFRLKAINKSFRPMIGGDFGIYAMRPDAGKTTFLTSESSFWVKQLDEVWPGEERVGIWFNNEGPGRRIKQRFYQSALGATVPEMVAMVKAGTLTSNLVAALGYDPKVRERMLFFDIHGMNSFEVEQIMKQYKVGFAIFDMIDNIRFVGEMANGGTRTDQMLEQMYGQVRIWCVKHDCIGWATSQISGDGAGLQYPTMTMLKDSKTGKQGACDFILMGGKLDDPTMEPYRYLGAPKNKLHKPGGPKDPRSEVLFDAERGRFNDPQET